MFGFIGNIGPWELVFILAIALIVVGPGKLPEVAKSMGKAVNEFKKSTSGVKKEFENAIKFDDPPVVKPAAVNSETLQTIVETKTEVVNTTESAESNMEEKNDSTANPVN
ncbi:MAG: twin-arginine translocase TatA/TatE family subunit [Syntrophomonadaceae bacterium]